MGEREIRERIGLLRAGWRQARDARMARTRELLAAHAGRDAVRRDRACRELRKKQRRCAVLMRHLERRLNRSLARETKKP